MNATMNLSMQAPHRQRGAILVTALVILLVLALLGVSAMNSTAMEQKMAGNTMATNIAFQAAESGLASSGNAEVSLVATLSATYTYGRGTAVVATAPNGLSDIKRTDAVFNVYGNGFRYADFDQTSSGSAGDARAVLHQGMKQVIPAE